MDIGLKNLFIGLVTNANVAVYTPLVSGILARISSASVYNDDSADQTITVWIVPSGGAGSAAAQYLIYSAKNVPSKQSLDLSLLRGKNIMGTGSLVVVSSANNKLTLAVAGIEVFS